MLPGTLQIRFRMRLPTMWPRAATWAAMVLLMIASATHGAAPMPNDPAARQRYADGRAEFETRWVVFPNGGGHWGRGPQASAESCADCHRSDGRRRAPRDDNDKPQSLVLRLSVPGTDTVGGPRPHPAYGEQLDSIGVLGRLIEEGTFRVRYRSHGVRLRDGTGVQLRKPEVRITSLWFGPLGADTVQALRLAQPLTGVGLLEQVPASALHEIAARQRRLGFDGRPNRVWDHSREAVALGRFGHKASQPSLRQQVASALMVDIGVNSRLFPTEDCWPAQRRCYDIGTVSGYEASDARIDTLVDYLRGLVPPPPRAVDTPEIRRGALLFDQAQCAVCHAPELPLADGRRIHPYSDLLLHDLGAGLADGRREFEAGPRDWRTAPLWGIGRDPDSDAGYLHDGRARSLTEAVLWHGGEAQQARDAFAAMSRIDRDALLAFLRSL